MPAATLLEPVVFANSASNRWRRCCCRSCWRPARRGRWRRCRRRSCWRTARRGRWRRWRRRSCWRTARGAGGDVVVAGRVGAAPTAGGDVAVAGRVSSSALVPVATLSSPVVFENSASRPVATLSLPVGVGGQRGDAARRRCYEPVVLRSSALAPVATLSLPVVLEDSASLPVATLPSPVVLESSAPSPVATLCAAGEVGHHRAAQADVVVAGEGPVEEGLAGGGVVVGVEVDAADIGAAGRGTERGADRERDGGREREHPSPPSGGRLAESGTELGGHLDLPLDRVGRRPSGASRWSERVRRRGVRPSGRRDPIPAECVRSDREDAGRRRPGRRNGSSPASARAAGAPPVERATVWLPAAPGLGHRRPAIMRSSSSSSARSTVSGSRTRSSRASAAAAVAEPLRAWSVSSASASSRVAMSCFFHS